MRRFLQVRQPVLVLFLVSLAVSAASAAAVSGPPALRSPLLEALYVPFEDMMEEW